MEGEKKSFIEKIAGGEKDPAKSVDRVYDRFVEDDINDIVDGGELKHAEFFYSCFKDDIKIVDANGGYVYNHLSRLYERQTIPFIIHKICTYLDTMIVDLFKQIVGQANKTDQCTKLMKALKTVRKNSHGKAVFELCLGRFYDPSFEAQLDKTPYLLPIRHKKVIDLRNLTVRYRERDDMFSFTLNVDFITDPKKDHNHARDFFYKIFNENKDVYDYFQKVVGYCITGETEERTIFICYGVGSNGKSSVFELIKECIGKFYTPVDKKVMIKDDSHGGSHTAHLIPLMKARLATYSETDEKDTLNMALLKKLRGEEEISARRLYGEQFSFKPCSKYCIMTNLKPDFNINDQASIDSIRFIPFKARFVAKPKKNEYLKDPHVVEALKTTYIDEVFTWLCIGAKKYYDEVREKKEIVLPNVLKLETQQYINDIDTVQQFITEMCDHDDNKQLKDSILRSELYGNYLVWMAKEGKKPKGSADFSLRLTNLGYEAKREKGVFKVKGMTMKQNNIFED